MNVAKAGTYITLPLYNSIVIGAYKRVCQRKDKADILYEYLNWGQAKIVVKA
jgi:hypothetical protein